MTKMKLAQGLRKYIRREKAHIRKTVSDTAEQNRLIKELVGRFYPSPRNSGVREGAPASGRAGSTKSEDGGK